MSEGLRLHIRPFSDGLINLAIIGDDNILGDPELLNIINRLDKDIALMCSSESNVDLNDQKTTSIYLESSIVKLNDWFQSRVFIQATIQKSRDDQVIEISSQIAVMTSRFLQENIAILILDASLEALFVSTTKSINENKLASLQQHLKGWISVSSHVEQLLPELLFLKNMCVGVKALKRFYVICALEWTGSIGSSSITSKVRSWLSTLSRRLGP